MSGLSFHASQIEGLLVDKGYPLLLESYSMQPAFFPSFAEVDVGDYNSLASRYPDFPYGYKAGSVLGMGRPIEIEHGQEFPADTLAGGYAPQFKVRKLARRITFTREDWTKRNGLDAISMKLTDTMRGWGETFAAEAEQIVADHLQKGTLSAGSTATFKNAYLDRPATDGLVYDGVAYFATNHPQDDGSGTTYSNLTVSAALTSATLQTGLTLMTHTNAKNGRGERILVRPNRLIVPPSLQFTAATLLTSANAPGTANNDANVNQFTGALQLVVNPYLTDDNDAWWLSEAGKGLKVIHTGDPTVEVVEDPRFQTVTVMAYKYIGVGVTNWRFAAAFNKAAS